jgi:hypothetical protein
MAVQTHNPGLYELSYEDTKITFMAGAVDGAPRLSYSGPLGRRDFEGDALQLHESPRGLEISVMFETHLQTVTLTVFVPELELGDTLEQSFRTVGIHTTQRRSIAGGPGADMSTQPLEVEGVARLLEYRAAETTLL